jgi:Na+(H+)/acetate symporter ActP
MLLVNCAILATALFTGAAVYISLVEHPARLSCPTTHAVEQWRPSYARATVMQAALAIAGALLSVAAWLSGAGAVWPRGLDGSEQTVSMGKWRAPSTHTRPRSRSLR